MSNALPVTDAEFESEVLKKDGLIIVDFYADWCGPCKVMSPVLDKFAEQNPEMSVRKIDVDHNPESAAKYGIRGIPTLLFFRDGETKLVKVGGQSLEDLVSIVKDI